MASLTTRSHSVLAFLRLVIRLRRFGPMSLVELSVRLVPMSSFSTRSWLEEKTWTTWVFLAPAICSKVAKTPLLFMVKSMSSGSVAPRMNFKKVGER